MLSDAQRACRGARKNNRWLNNETTDAAAKKREATTADAAEAAACPLALHTKALHAEHKHLFHCRSPTPQRIAARRSMLVRLALLNMQVRSFNPSMASDYRCSPQPHLSPHQGTNSPQQLSAITQQCLLSRTTHHHPQSSRLWIGSTWQRSARTRQTRQNSRKYSTNVRCVISRLGFIQQTLDIYLISRLLASPDRNRCAQHRGPIAEALARGTRKGHLSRMSGQTPLSSHPTILNNPYLRGERSAYKQADPSPQRIPTRYLVDTSEA